MPGPPPSDDRVRRAAPIRGDWRTAPGVGWMHGKWPDPPAGVTEATATAWRTWGAAWFASFWQPSDLPALRVIASLYDRVERGEFVRSAELRMWSDSFGITPRGRQSLRWKPPAEGATRAPAAGTSNGSAARKRYGHLTVAAGPAGDAS